MPSFSSLITSVTSDFDVFTLTDKGLFERKYSKVLSKYSPVFSFIISSKNSGMEYLIPISSKLIDSFSALIFLNIPFTKPVSALSLLCFTRFTASFIIALSGTLSI